MDLAPEAISVSTNQARGGTQSLRYDGAWLAPQASGFSLAGAYLRAAELPSQDPAVIVEITASVRLDGPQTGVLGTPEQDELGPSILAYALTPAGTGDLLGGIKASSAGRIWNISRAAEDNYRYSIPYTLGTWRTLTIRVDFQVRRLTWLVDDVELGSGPFADSVTSDRLFSGSLFVIAKTDPKSTPDYNYDPANYTAYFDDYSLKSIPLEGPALLVEQPAGVRLANGAATVDFGNNLAGTPSPRVFTLRNAGNAPITGVTVTLAGTNAPEFALTAPPSGTIAPGTNTSFTLAFTPTAGGPRSATLRIASNDPDDNPFTVALTGRGRTPAEIVQQAYLKASNTGAGDFFGASVAISGDTMVIGAGGEDSNATGVNGNQNNNSAMDSGAAYVFVRQGTNWTQQAYLKASNTRANDYFGGLALSTGGVAISGDTILVGASGTAYIFVRSGTNWSQQASLDGFGGLAISGDTVLVGAAVWVRTGTNWTQQAYLTGSNTDGDDYFGVFPYSVSIAGNTIVVGAPEEDSNAVGVNGDQGNNSSTNSGAAYVFVREGTNWTQQAYLKASNTGVGDYFGAVSISGDTIVVGAIGEASNATGIDGNQNNNSASGSGAAYVFVRNGTNWVQQAYLKASNTGAEDWFGFPVGISGDTIVVGAHMESSNARGVNGNQNNNNSQSSGAAYVFLREGTHWTQQAYLKASNADGRTATEFGDLFGAALAISGDTIVVGADNEDSNATGVNGNQSNNSAGQSGAAYVFTGAGPTPPPQLRLSAVRIGDMLQLTATGTANTRWRLESRDILTGTNGWQPFTNLTLGPSPTVIQQPLSSTHRFYRGAWVR